MIGALLLMSVAVLPADRLAMADRLFNKGKYAEADAEYRALAGEKSLAADEVAFRLAECDRVLGRTAAARKGYAELCAKFPDSRHVSRARFMHAMGASGEERRRLLAALDSDRVEKEIRAAALYHLGSENSDREALSKCVKIDPKGKYAPYANLKYATLLVNSDSFPERRKGVEVLLAVAFSDSALAGEALYLAAIQSYRDKKYGEAGSLFRRYRKNHPGGEHDDEARTMSAWCDFMEGRFADAAATCGEGETDDLAYIRAACAYSTGDNARAISLFRQYLENFPQGRYRADAELPIARIEFDLAQAANDPDKIVESARRSLALSKQASDHLRLAWAYEKAGKPELAAAEYALIAQRHPQSEEAAEALYRKAMIAARADDWPAAELALAEALAGGKLGKRRSEALYWRGVALMRLEHEADGAKSLSEAVAAGIGAAENREARLMLADWDCREGRLDAAKSAYRELVKSGACDRMSAQRMLAVGRMIGGEEAEICAKALAKNPAPEWRQAGWELLGECEERRERYAAAIDAYRKSLAEPVRTEAAAAAALRLGKLEFRAGEYDLADKTLKAAVSLNSADASARAEAYVTLAKNARAKGDLPSACAYATVVTSLFDDEKFCAEARKILDERPETKP